MSKDWSGWYGIPSTGKVKCKACNSVFAKKIGRMLSHLEYEDLSSVRDTGVSLCSQLTPDVRALFIQSNGTFP